MSRPLPLFDLSDLARVSRECEQLRAKLRRGGMDIRSRIRTEQKLTLAVARQLRLEQRFANADRRQHV